MTRRMTGLCCAALFCCGVTLAADGQRSTTATHTPDFTTTSIDRAPITNQALGGQGAGGFDLPTDFAWGRDEADPGLNTANFQLATPGTVNVIGPSGIGQFCNGFEFAGPNFGTLYALPIDNTLYAINTGTGAAAPIGAANPVGGQSWTGLAWNQTNFTMYATSTDITSSNLYSINLTTGAATLIGNMNSPGIIALAIDCNGNAYAYDIVSDNFGSVNLANGAYSAIGALGFDSNFGQGMDFDDSTGQLYMAAFNNTTFQAELRLVDTSNGSSTFLGTIGTPGVSQFGSIAIAQSCNFTPVNGACCNEPAGACQDDVSILDCLFPGARFLPEGSCDDFDPPCGLQPGACCYEDGACLLTPGQFCRTKVVGDMNCDGVVNFGDIDPFVLALQGENAYYGQYPGCNWANGDINGDGVVNFGDIDPFVAALGGGTPAAYAAQFLGAGTTCAACPCVVRCPAGSTQEQEPCGADTNGGCNAPVPTFEPIACGETKCGTGWFDGTNRDTDWYELVVPGLPTEGVILTITAEAEFPVLAGLLEQIVPGVPGCDNVTGFIEPAIIVNECTPTAVTTVCLPPGTYYLFAAPQFLNTVACPADYYLTVTCEPCALPVGACCFFPSGACADSVTEFECNAAGGNFQGGGTDCTTVVCPVPPPNDVCSGAQPIDMSGGFAIVNLDNTFASDDLTPDCPGGNNSPPRNGLWYSVVGDGTSFTITTCSPGTVNFDTRIQIWCSCDLIDCVGGNDDDLTCPLFSPAWTSTFTWCTAPGKTYYIIVGGFGLADIGPIEMVVASDFAACTPSAVEACTPCEVPCPPNGVNEQEVCGTNTNDGCNIEPPGVPAFEPIACGETKCGTAWYDGNLRDTDWYELVISTPQTLTISADAEFEYVFGLIEQITPGVPGCDNITGNIAPFGTALKCTPTSVTSACLTPGTYYVFMAPAFTGLVNCPARYTLSVACEPCVPTYCAAGSDNCSPIPFDDEHIVLVTLNTINNASGGDVPGCYSDFTAISTDLQVGQSYGLTIVNSTDAWSADEAGAWIDWNQDLAFDASEAIALSGTPGVGPYTGTVTVPGSATLGSTRFRCRIVFAATPAPCGVTSFGEVEDYTVNVVP